MMKGTFEGGAEAMALMLANMNKTFPLKEIFP
jgi:hypothetical protein